MPRPNLFTDTLPSTVTVGGNVFPINTDYRIGIRFEELVRSKTVKDQEKFARSLMLWYGESGIPRDVIGAHNAAVQFFMCGRNEEEEKSQSAKPDAKRIYDYAHDGQYIYAAFYDQYHIDLTEAQLHWWKFRSMFVGLKPEHEFVKIMGYRACNLAQIKNKEERANIRRLKSLHALPSEVTVEDMRRKAGAMFGSMF